MANRPAAEFDVTPALARRLIADRFPELAELPLVELSRGWDNTNLRLGEHHLVRLPHRRAAAGLIEHEQRWLPELAPRLDLAIPAPTHGGRPTGYYPWCWSITPWIEGIEAARATLHDPAESARALGDFFRQLHVPAPPDAPANPFRGAGVHTRAESFRANRRALEHTDTAEDRIGAIADIFETACRAEPTDERVWLHGDLHTRNMVVNHGRLSAIIDWGDVCAGDRATDLAAAFMLVPDHLDIVRSAARATDDAWDRARGWAAHFALIYLAHSDDEPVMHDVGMRLFDTLVPGQA